MTTCLELNKVGGFQTIAWLIIFFGWIRSYDWGIDRNGCVQPLVLIYIDVGGEAFICYSGYILVNRTMEDMACVTIRNGWFFNMPCLVLLEVLSVLQL